MDPSMALVGVVVAFAAQLAPAPVPTRTKDSAPTSRTPADSAAIGRRLRLVRTTDGSPIGGAELFDVDLDQVDTKPADYLALKERPDDEFPRRGRRLVADGDGFVEIGPGRRHHLLARAPGWFQLVVFFGTEPPWGETIELLPDAPLQIDLTNAHGSALEGIPVELCEIMDCGNAARTNSTWRVASDRSGRVSFPHYSWWMEQGIDYLTPAIPLQEPPVVNAGRDSFFKRSTPAPADGIVLWQLPPLSTVRVEIADAKMLARDAPVTFELVGPHQFFGSPDRFTSDRAAPVVVPAEISVPLRALFHWREADSKWTRRERYAFGCANSEEGGCTVMRLEVANEPVALSLRVVRAADGAGAAAGASKAPVRFDAMVEWNDSRGIRWRDRVDGLKPDEAGAIEFEWRRPRLSTDERPATIHVSLRRSFHRWGWEPLDEPELAARDLPWPTGSELDVGKMIVSSAR
jgi:hypothetical protein